MSDSKVLRRLALPATPVAASLLVAGCASGPEVRADYDRSADCGGYRTYGFVSQTTPLPSGAPDFQSLAVQAIRSAGSPDPESAEQRSPGGSPSGLNRRPLV